MSFDSFIRRVRLLSFSFLALAAGTFADAQTPSQLRISPPVRNGWILLDSPLLPNTRFTLEASENLRDWAPIATLHDGAIAYPDVAAPNFEQRFYRASSQPRMAVDDWKNQLVLPNEPFRAPLQSGLRWVKFAILTNDPTRVYYQDSAKYLFHYDFARQRLPPFLGIDRAAFDQVSLHPPNQQIILGAVLFPQQPNVLEYGIQFVGLEPYAPATVGRMLELVSATIAGPPGSSAFYVPAWEQFDSATENEAFFAELGIPVASTDRWLGADSIYSAGWALGRLVFVRAGEINAAYTDGRLLPGDILLTDGVPAETPLVAGIITLRPSTPNSHVAILARSFGIPFVYLPDPDEQERVQGLAGRDVILRARIVSDRHEIKIVDVHGALTPELRSEILAFKAPPLLNIPAKTAYGGIAAPVDNLVPEDARFFGGKAANYGLLRRIIPNNSPPAIAFSFDLWDAFLDQTLANGKTLRTEISERLAPYSYPPNIASLRADLAGIRSLFTDTAQFTSAQQSAIINALASFDSARKIRFRSSTNMEDAEQFTGAGLYDSYSGCLDDELDGDSTGPSCCDGTEPNERGVFRAIKKVYASFYNDNAVLERLRHRVNESQVGMALLVHHSFPNEAANGVATMDARITPFMRYTTDLVTQLGEVSVANPEGDALPELVRSSRIGMNGGVSLQLEERSTLVPLGGYVLNWESDYRALMTLLLSVAEGYRQLYPAKPRFLLDFEYKKEGGAMVVKQVRPIPLPPSSGAVVPYLINEPRTFAVFQGEQSNVFANHRLKTRFALQTRSVRLTDPALQESLYPDGRFDYVENGTITTLNGPLSGWPNAAYALVGGVPRDTWSLGSGAARRDYELDTTLIRTVNAAESPLLTQSDFSRVLRVRYATPQPTVDQLGQPLTTMQEIVRLIEPPRVTPTSILKTRTYSTARRAGVETSFYWPEDPQAAAGYTAPLVDWVETRITGLTSEPIVLRGYYSQTYRPEHHNFAEHFIFEPRLEAGISSEIIAELNAANIKLIYFRWAGPQSQLNTLGFDDVFRPVP